MKLTKTQSKFLEYKKEMVKLETDFYNKLNHFPLINLEIENNKLMNLSLKMFLYNEKHFNELSTIDYSKYTKQAQDIRDKTINLLNNSIKKNEDKINENEKKINENIINIYE
jgi:hypothetical protein